MAAKQLSAVEIAMQEKLAAASAKLIEASKEGTLPKMSAALSEGASIDAVNEHGNTPLMLCACNGHLEAVQLLLSNSPPPKINEVDNHFGWTALMFAAHFARDDCLRLLLNAQPPPSIKVKSLLGKTAYDLAQTPEIKSQLQIALLMEAAKCGDIDVISDYLKSEVGQHDSGNQNLISTTNADGYTALNYACLHGQTNVVRLLLENMPAPSISDIMDSTSTASVPRYNPIDLPNNDGNSALLTACEKGHAKIVELLLQANPPADVSLTNKAWRTAVNIASSKGHLEVVRCLLMAENKPLLDIQDDEGETALIRAAALGHAKIVQVLLRANPPPQIDLQGNYQTRSTALMRAAENEHLAVVQVMMANKPTPNVHLRNANGDTAWDLAHSKAIKHAIRPPLIVRKVTVMATEKSVNVITFHYSNNTEASFGSSPNAGLLPGDLMSKVSERKSACEEKEPFLLDSDEYIVTVYATNQQQGDSDIIDASLEELVSVQFETNKKADTPSGFRRSVVYGKRPPPRQKDLPQKFTDSTGKANSNKEGGAVAQPKAIVAINRFQLGDQDIDNELEYSEMVDCPAIVSVEFDDPIEEKIRLSSSSCVIA